MKTPIEQVKEAFCADDAAGVKALLGQHPELKGLVNEPVGPFDSPAITCARSREMIDVLLEAGADINAKSRWWAGGFGLLHGAEPELAEYAIERGAVVDIHAAARLGKMERVEALLKENPALVQARGGDGQTPLHFAANVEIAALLLEHGAEMDACDIDHESTPAQYMVRERQEVARYLVGRGCRTDLLMAAALGNVDLVRRHLAADPESVRMEVSDEFFPKRNPRSGGTIYNWTLGAHKTAHVVAREFGHEEIVELLLEASPDEVKLSAACELGDRELLAALLGRRPGLAQSLPPKQVRRIADAARNNDTNAVRLMVEAGWPVEVRGQHGGTPLHWAGFHGNLEMAELLLEKGPPLEMLDFDFQATPLGWVIHGSEHGWHRKTGDYAGTAEALLRAGVERPETFGGTEAVQEVLRGRG